VDPPAVRRRRDGRHIGQAGRVPRREPVTTWAYRFVILEVSSKLGRHYWRNPPGPLDAWQWERLPGRLGIDPHQHAEAAGIPAEVRRVVDDELTAHHRRAFVAIVIDGIALDAVAARLGLQRNAIYKAVFDARRKIRRALVTRAPGRAGRRATMRELERLDRFLRTDPRDVGCAEAMAILRAYADLVAGGQDAAGRYPGVAAHLAACGPCGEDFAGLLTAVASH
jgi:DNA-directed RNA polymerase specialized sigma24 family protein